MRSVQEYLQEILAGGFSRLQLKMISSSRRLLRIGGALSHGIWAVPAVLIIRLIRPFVVIRVGGFSCLRIGHFAADAGHQWAKLQDKPANMVDWFWIQEPTCNKQWAKMVKRNFPCYFWVKHLYRWNLLLPGGSLHHRPPSKTGSRDIGGILERAQAKMEFLPEEEREAKTWLRSQGWKEEDPFVCVLVRDSAYLGTTQRLCQNDWNYHNYRDSDIATYVPALEWLANQGVWVLRMGRIMSKPILSSHPRVIDYAFSPEKNDLLDIWLFANCHLCISTGSGPDIVSDVYRRPLLFLNFIPVSCLFSWSNAMHLPKTLVWKESGKPLTLQEHIQHSYFQQSLYDHAGIEIVDMTPEEITSAVQECWQRQKGDWIDTDEDLALQRRFWEILMAHPEFLKYHGWIHPEARIGANYLRKAQSYFFDNDSYCH